jgi:hypothetical protein
MSRENGGNAGMNKCSSKIVERTTNYTGTVKDVAFAPSIRDAGLTAPFAQPET